MCGVTGVCEAGDSEALLCDVATGRPQRPRLPQDWPDGSRDVSVYEAEASGEVEATLWDLLDEVRGGGSVPWARRSEAIGWLNLALLGAGLRRRPARSQP
jgi:hypothetical protein